MFEEILRKILNETFGEIFVKKTATGLSTNEIPEKNANGNYFLWDT